MELSTRIFGTQRRVRPSDGVDDCPGSRAPGLCSFIMPKVKQPPILRRAMGRPASAGGVITHLRRVSRQSYLAEAVPKPPSTRLWTRPACLCGLDFLLLGNVPAPSHKERGAAPCHRRLPRHRSRDEVRRRSLQGGQRACTPGWPSFRWLAGGVAVGLALGRNTFWLITWLRSRMRPSPTSDDVAAPSDTRSAGEPSLEGSSTSSDIRNVLPG